MSDQPTSPVEPVAGSSMPADLAPPPPVPPGAMPPGPPPAPPLYTWERPPEPVGPAPGIRFAGYGARLIAYIVDGILIGVATTIVSVLLALVFAGFAASGSNGAAGLTILLLVAVVFVIAIGYFPWFWSRGGQTPGMRMVRIRVVRDRDGGPVTGGMAVIRFIGYIINSMAFYIGWIWILVDGRRRGWHDLLAGTVVIDA